MNTTRILARNLLVGDEIVTEDGYGAMRATRVYVSPRMVITVLEDACPKDFNLDTPITVRRAS